MTNKNQVIITPNCFYGYIDDNTPCGKAKANQVKADLETLAIMLQDDNLSPETKKAIYIDYAEAIREYVEREETCCDCTNDCDCKCDCEEEEPYEEEEEEELIIDDMERYAIYFGKDKVIDCDDYIETIKRVEVLLQLNNPELRVYGYDGQGEMYRLNIIDRNGEISLEMPE